MEKTQGKRMTGQEKEFLYLDIIERASRMGLEFNDDRLAAMMDIESADRKFNLRLEEWLKADDLNFIHDWAGIRDSILRNHFPATDFRGFVPRFAARVQ